MSIQFVPIQLDFWLDFEHIQYISVFTYSVANE